MKGGIMQGEKIEITPEMHRQIILALEEEARKTRPKKPLRLVAKWLDRSIVSVGNYKSGRNLMGKITLKKAIKKLEEVAPDKLEAILSGEVLFEEGVEQHVGKDARQKLVLALIEEAERLGKKEEPPRSVQLVERWLGVSPVAIGKYRKGQSFMRDDVCKKAIIKLKELNPNKLKEILEEDLEEYRRGIDT